MKKIICALLALVLVLTGVVGWLAFRKNPYEKYAGLFRALEEGDYSAAISYIAMLQLQGGANIQPGGNENGDSGKPTDEERKLLDKYFMIYNYLTKCLDSGLTYVIEDDNGQNISGQEALQYCYETLPKLSAIDKWANSDYVNQYSEVESWDWEALLQNFTVIENVPLSIQCTVKDNLGNISTQSVTEWKYNANGTVSEIKGENEAKPIAHAKHSCVWPEYDAQGRVVKKTAGWSKNDISAIITYTYDAAGNIVTEHVKTNTDETEYTYTYENGRLAKIFWLNEYNNRYTIEYSYDASGKLVKEVKTCLRYISYIAEWAKNSVTIMDYAYTDGVLTAGTYTEQGWYSNTMMADWQERLYEYVAAERIDQYTYTCDDQGRVLTETVIPGNAVDTYGEGTGEILSKAKYESKTYEHIYGTYYIYTPAQ